MTPLEIGPISPFFIVSDLSRTLRFYVDRLEFDVRFSGPPEEPFFAIVGRGPVQIHLKMIDDAVHPAPNHTRHEWAPWDAFVYVDEVDALAQELGARGVPFREPVADRDDGLRGFSVSDPDGYVLFFGRPN